MSATAFQRRRRELANKKKKIQKETPGITSQKLEQRQVEEKLANEMARDIYQEMKVDELKEKAKERELKGYSGLKKDDLIDLLVGDYVGDN